jgi:hypothetical protein
MKRRYCTLYDDRIQRSTMSCSNNIYITQMKSTAKLYEEEIARQPKEIEEVKRQLHDAYGKHTTEIKSIGKFHEEKLTNSKCLLQELQTEYDKLLDERDAAGTDLDDLRQKYKQRVFMIRVFIC